MTVSWHRVDTSFLGIQYYAIVNLFGRKFSSYFLLSPNSFVDVTGTSSLGSNPGPFSETRVGNDSNPFVMVSVSVRDDDNDDDDDDLQEFNER